MKIVGNSEAAPCGNCASPADFVPGAHYLKQWLARDLAGRRGRDFIKGVEFF